MFELKRAGEKTYYIDCPAKIGICLTDDGGAYLVDSGNDKDAGKKVLKLLEENRWRLKGIVNTHSHADHIGGNGYLQRQTGCKIFAKGIERAFVRDPVLEPSFLYGGYPCKDLRHKFLLAQESEAFELSHEAFPKELEVIPLKGHSFDMIGIRTADDVVFLADCVSSESTLQKYPVSFLYDVEEYLHTLEAVEKLKAKLFVPAHAPAAEDIGALVRLNRQKVFEISEKIQELLKAPMCFEALLKRIFEEYGLNMSFEQYVLVGSTVRSYLSWLRDQGKVQALFEDCSLLWKS